MFINDLIWIITAILCVFYDNPVITIVVIITTLIYAIDLIIKFKQLDYKFVPFVKKHWLDILFLIPICKIFRGFRIIKVGRILIVADTVNDFTEILFRLIKFIKRKINFYK